jgi:hypothetical protein
MNISLSHLADQDQHGAINKHSTKPFSREDKKVARNGAATKY